MTLADEMLHTLCPLHAVINHSGHVRQAGPTLHKLVNGPLEGQVFFDLFSVYRPRVIESVPDLLRAQGRKLSLKLNGPPELELKAAVAATSDGGAVINCGFGIGLLDAVRRYQLTSTDFAATDLAIEMLWLMEAKSLAIDASRSLNTRLQDAVVQAEERAFTDTLTGLGNRRALDAQLDRISRQGTPFSLMHIDLDLFKQVNDTLGHAAGDAVLRHAARIMVDETRKDDLVARVGGDEFIIVVPHLVGRNRLADLARLLIARIEEPVPFADQVAQISASIGIAVSEGGQVDPEALIDAADTALYASKRAGRAQFSFYESGLAVTSKV
ncbi:diguanylate cyclase domain-containing protein [Sagittula sp. SSi028]|uniref:diguanylate cyclase domain-containing protein n=1 Tax=Sagittula sp. SSi028 TaxID=3400636 RepID=UPI003AF73CEB